MSGRDPDLINKLTLPRLVSSGFLPKTNQPQGSGYAPNAKFQKLRGCAKILLGLSPAIRRSDSKNNNLHHVRLVSLDQRQRLSDSAFGENERVAMRRSENDCESEEVEMAKTLSIHLHYIGHTQYLSLRHTHHQPPEHTTKVTPLLLLTTSINSPTG